MTIRAFLALGAVLSVVTQTAACDDQEFTSGEPTSAGTEAGTGSGGAGAGGGAPGSGGTPASSSAAQGGAGGVACQSLGDACSDCSFTNCSAQYCDCYAEQDCAALVGCFNACPPGDQACQQTCMTDHKDSISKSFVLGDCAAMSCATSCPGVTALEPCTECLFTSCAPQMNTCLANPECAAILQCVQATCPPPISTTCALGCANQHPNGQGDAAPLNSCLSQQCSNDC